MTDKALPVKEMEKFAEGETPGTVIVRGVLVDQGTSSTNLQAMSRITRENKKFDDLGRVRIVKVTT
jgi:hypothetical protein